MRIAMIGQRGVPASFGGVEHHVEELGARLAARGHEVTVFCRPNYVDGQPSEHRGMRLVHVPTVGTKHLDAIVHSGLSSLASLGRGYDLVHYHALGPGLASPLPRWGSSAKVVQTIHGLDHQRGKWSPAGQRVLTAAAWMSARVPDATIVVSRDLARHYADRYARDTTYIPNGVEPGTRRPPDLIRERFGLERGSYVLFVGRFVPEKAPDVLIRAFRGLDHDVKLVLAGGSSFTTEYVTALEREAAGDDRIVFPGYVYGEVLEELYTNAAVFVLPSSLEGLPLTLLEAASYGTPIVASDIPPHREVLGEDGPGRRLVPVGEATALQAAIAATLYDRDAAVAGAAALRDHVLAAYRWDDAAAATEGLYRRVLGSPTAPVVRAKVDA